MPGRVTAYIRSVMANPSIDRLRIASPCSMSWEAMEGDERVRHCTLCSLNVYNIAEMTRDEVRALLAQNEGRVCMRLYRRADGTVLTRDCPRGLGELRRRASRAAAAVVAAVLSFPAFAFGAVTSKAPRIKVCGSKVELTIEQTPTPQPAAFTGVAVADDVPLPGVTVVLRNESGGPEINLVTDAHGAFTFSSLGAGTYRVEFLLAGLKRATIKHLELQPSVVTHVRVTMKVEAMESITVGGAGPDPLAQTSISTTFTQSFIDKLPH